jgi:hypothetical protein
VEFVKFATTASMALVICDNLTSVKDALPDLADRIGVRPEVVDATFAALSVDIGRQYNRSALIPEVTRIVRETIGYTGAALALDGKRVCDRIGTIIESLRKIN